MFALPEWPLFQARLSGAGRNVRARYDRTGNFDIPKQIECLNRHSRIAQGFKNGGIIVKSKLLEWIRRLSYKIILPFLESYLHPTDERIHLNPFIAGKYYPLGWSAAEYIVLKANPNDTEGTKHYPIPPIELWEGYAENPEEYLFDAQEDVGIMLSILERAGASPETLTRVLDFGCAAGRMLRFYPNVTNKSELWGVDINAKHIVWCQQHLSPPLLFTKYKDHRLFVGLVNAVRKFDQKTSVCSQNYASFAIQADPCSQVFYDVDHLARRWGRLATVVSVNQQAHDHQSAILLRKESGRLHD